MDENDLGNFVDLELYKPQTWNKLLEDKSLAKLNIKVKDVQEKFDEKNIKAPRSLRFANSENDFGTIYFTAMSPAGIGINILGIDKYPRSSAFKYDAIDSINILLILFKKNI